MSQGPLGLAAAPVCWAIVDVAPRTGRASASIRARLILVFMLILCALPHFVPAFVRDGMFCL
jgi:hypothetical protein